MQKTKALQNIERKMEELDPHSLRYRVLENARDFKRSWIELGQSLFSVHRQKSWKEWGYLTFEAYCAKEIGIKQGTALKMLRSYSFLEREEPAFLERTAAEERKPAEIPGYEAVNALRLAKESERLSDKQYEALREDVLEAPKEDAEVKKKVRYLLKSGPKKAEAEEPAVRRAAVAKRLLSGIKSARADMNELEFPVKLVRAADSLVELLEDYLKL